MCKSKRSYVPVALNQCSYRLYMDDLKAITRIIKKKTPKVPAYDGRPTKPESNTDEEMEF